MNNKVIFAAIAIAMVYIAGAAIIMNQSESNKPINHNLDTEKTITNTWNVIDGWDEKYIFIETDKSYHSARDSGMISNHNVTLVSGSLPPGVEAYARHDDWTYYGYAWVFDDGGSSQTKSGGTWSGTLQYTVDDDSKYDGTEYTLHFTLTRKASGSLYYW